MSGTEREKMERPVNEAETVPSEVLGVVMPVDATLEIHRDKPLWCIYGPDCFPTLFCCKILNHPEFGLTIWGYSVYRGEPGFRTLGRNLSGWMRDMLNMYSTKVTFYETLDDALAVLRLLATPRA